MIHPVFNKRQTLLTYTVEELTQMLSHNRLRLRETNASQVRLFRKYIIQNIETNSIYLPPIVANVPFNSSLDEGKLAFLHVVDGSLRIHALTSMREIITRLQSSEDTKEQKQGYSLQYALSDLHIAIQLIEGLTESEEDQLFIDLNSKGKKVSLSKRISYDSRSTINRVTNELLASNRDLHLAGVEMEKSSISRPHNKKLLSLSQLRSIVGLFLYGKNITSQLAIEQSQHVDIEQRVELLTGWLEELFTLYPAKSIGNFEESMLASFPLQMAVARYALYREEEVHQKEVYVRARMQRLQDIDWSRENNTWQQFKGARKGREQYYYLQNDQQTIQTIVDWLNMKGGE